MKNFLKYSVLLGKDPALVQGAGGNTSYKNPKGELVVKASGYFLKDLKNKRGYVTCNNKKILAKLSKIRLYAPNMESEFDSFLKQTLNPKKSFGRPSIETSLHAAIPSRHVFHTHSAYANIFNFAKNGEAELKKIFTGYKVLFIGYKNPGLELGLALFKLLKSPFPLPSIIFLKNHGLITHHDNPAIAYNLTLLARNKIIKYLKTQKGYTLYKVINKPAGLKKHMFPDSVVYSQINFKKLSAEKREVFYEICSMINYTQRAMANLGLKPQFLSAKNINFLVNMDQEKHRINMLVKS